MEPIYRGKTKDVYKLPDGNYMLRFKDDVTGKDGVFDPGANTVGLTMDGSGRAALKTTTFFFNILKNKNIPSHYIESDISNNTMKVLPAKLFGKGVEVICRYKAVGSFIRRYGAYAKEGQPLDAYVEITLKDDARNDPLITEDALEILNIMDKDEYRILVSLTRDISEVVRGELAKKGLDLYDIKLEFGRVGDNGQIALIDEISGGNMRVYRNGVYVEPLRLEKLLLET